MGSLQQALTTVALTILFPLGCNPYADAQVYSRNLAPYRMVSNVTYVKRGQWEGKLDVYSRIAPPGPEPTLVGMHGGDTLSGSKDGALFNILPYLELGWNVVNVEHRLPGVTLAPAALQDAVAKIGDIAVEKRSRRVTVAFNRYRWEGAGGERVRSALQIGSVMGVQARNLRRGAKGAVVELLALRFEPGESPGGVITLSFAGDGDLRLSVECVDAVLTDVSEAWATPRKPHHDA